MLKLLLDALAAYVAPLVVGAAVTVLVMWLKRFITTKKRAERIAAFAHAAWSGFEPLAKASPNKWDDLLITFGQDFEAAMLKLGEGLSDADKAVAREVFAKRMAQAATMAPLAAAGVPIR